MRSPSGRIDKSHTALLIQFPASWPKGTVNAPLREIIKITVAAITERTKSRNRPL
jgi:hypothetical protein